MAAAQIKQAGKLSPGDEKALSAEAEKMSMYKDVKRAVYKGGARFEFELEDKHKKGEPLNALNIFTVRTDKEGVMTITSAEVKEPERKEMAKLGIAIDGTMEVRIPRNTEVIHHNAASTPTFGFGAYKWTVGSIDQRPIIKIKFKS